MIVLGIINGIINIAKKFVFDLKYPSTAEIKHIKAEFETDKINPQTRIIKANLMVKSNII